MKYIKPKLVLGRELRYYFNEHVAESLGTGFYTLKKDLLVFKKIYHGVDDLDAIANLIIPAGSEVYCPYTVFISNDHKDNRKMRANKAFVHSIVTKGALKQVKQGFSGYDRSFKYRVGRNVKPDYFSTSPYKCTGGVHFFMNVSDALHW